MKATPKQSIIYTPESPLRHPRSMVRAMGRDLRASWELAWRLIVRDISAQYRQTVFGYLWALLPPLVTSLLFILLNKYQILSIKNISVPYPVYVITGTVFWQLFVDALNAPLKEIADNKAMLSKIDFPKEALVISGLGQVLFSFLIKTLLLAAVFIAFRVSIAWTSFLVILPVAGLLGLGTLIGVLLVPLGVLYKDVQQALAVIIQPLMLLTPVVYPPPSEGFLAAIIRYNPLTPLIITTRAFLMTGIPSSLAFFLSVCGGTFIFLFIGWIIYRVALPILIERMEA